MGPVRRRATFFRRSGRLVADPSDDQVGRAQRRRRWALIGSGLIVVITAAATVLTVVASTTPPAVPAATLSPIAIPEYTPPPATPVPTESAPPANLVTGTVGGQRVFIRPPAGSATGIVYILPDAGDDAGELLSGTLPDSLNAAGLAVATGDLGGTSWGSPASSTSLSELRAWAEGQVGDVPVMYFGVGMGVTTAVTALSRQPDVEVTCTYAVAPVTDLATLATSNPRVREQITTSWGRVPAAEENPSLLAAGLPTSVDYRVVVPAAPEDRVDDANNFIAALEQSGHTVTSTVASEDARVGSLTRDILLFGSECLA